MLLGGEKTFYILIFCVVVFFPLHAVLHAEAPGIERYEQWIINRENHVLDYKSVHHTLK